MYLGIKCQDFYNFGANYIYAELLNLSVDLKLNLIR